MKLLRLKITDSQGFRSLPRNFEHHFRSEWSLQDELAQPEDFAPFVCTGINGSGKSNLLEVLAVIFYQLEVQRVKSMHGGFLPEVFRFDPIDNRDGIKDSDGSPNAYELEYFIRVPKALRLVDSPDYAHVRVLKELDKAPQLQWVNNELFGSESQETKFSRLTEEERSFPLPQYVLGYSSGENEILSLPFFKMRFIQFDEYWNAITQQLPFAGRPETRMAFLDNEFSQAILLCNLLFQDQAALQSYGKDVGIESLKEFRIIIKRSIEVPPEVAEGFMGGDYVEPGYVEDDYIASNSALQKDRDSGRYTVNLMQLLEAGPDSAKNFDPLVTRLKRCASLSYTDDATDTLILDYWVNDATRKAFEANFTDGLQLFQAFQVLLTLNLHTVSDTLKLALYRSDSHYVSETVPRLASDERVMRFMFVRFAKRGVAEPLMLKSLSDGEHQLLHSVGLCLLFRDTNSLFLLDEPETHFNPGWRANFLSRLRQGMRGSEDSGQEILITTHSPFLISDSKPEKVLVFTKDKTSGTIKVSPPAYNTLGASINKITMNTFGKRETIGRHAQDLLEVFRDRFEQGSEDKESLITEIHQQLGDSVEKVLLIKAILDSDQSGHGEAQD